MTEQEWLTSTSLAPMLELISSKGSYRKWRLFGVAGCGKKWNLANDNRNRAAVQIAERCAELEETGIAEAGYSAWAAAHGTAGDLEGNLLRSIAFYSGSQGNLLELATLTNASDYCPLLREIFGNPFRTCVCPLEWPTSRVVSLGKSIYDDRAFDRLPILADALEEAGCTDESILSHCRGPGYHVLGCWAVDLILGKQ